MVLVNHVTFPLRQYVDIEFKNGLRFINAADLSGLSYNTLSKLQRANVIIKDGNELYEWDSWFNKKIVSTDTLPVKIVSTDPLSNKLQRFN